MCRGLWVCSGSRAPWTCAGLLAGANENPSDAQLFPGTSVAGQNIARFVRAFASAAVEGNGTLIPGAPGFKDRRDERFRQSLISGWYEHGDLTDKQWPWVSVLLKERTRTQLAEVVRFPGKLEEA